MDQLLADMHCGKVIDTQAKRAASTIRRDSDRLPKDVRLALRFLEEAFSLYIFVA
jgi:hypothetical protein